jgi:GNAT superfamily N-acetyltransferase
MSDDRAVSASDDAAPDALDRHGLRVVPMSPDLAAALVRFHSTLSMATTRSRFFAVHPHLSADEVTRFTTVDHEQREALVALAADGEIVAVARFDVVDGPSRTAEAAFVVADGWQHRGVGAALFARLARRAREVGVEQLVADTLVGNRAMRDVFRHAGLPMAEHLVDGVVTVTIELTAR